MPKNKYNLNDPNQFNLKIRNVNELNAAEHRAWNEDARNAARRMLDGVRSASSDFQDQALKWANQILVDEKRAKQPYNPNPDQPRDQETGRYVAQENALTRAFDNPSSEGTSFSDLDKPSLEDFLLEQVKAYQSKYEGQSFEQAPVRSSTVQPARPNLHETVLQPGMRWVVGPDGMTQVPARQAKTRTEYAPGHGAPGVVMDKPGKAAFVNIDHLTKRGNR
ncbi:hypothetical protein [Hyphomicrobium sp.]|uniref:hypothetical protein n=1 Tax=Hyphomicrobium sp. TaxID=82 RepID=UPI000F966B40|nr:hypothetical protein [Hyphomicrobium sp.]RUP00118.1 MAG: hypothetical protein EKK30_03110 [Hyphomicrobium sp.]